MRKKKLWLIIILILAAFLRFYQLNQNPPSLNWDEVSHGYNAYSILKTGTDEWGVRWPLIFRAYGDYKLPVYIYVTALSEAIFGVNGFAVRFPSALAGVLSVLLTYFLVKKLCQNLISKDLNILISLIAGFFLAISPWHIFLSRPAFEANLASFLVIAGIYFFLVGLKKKWLLSLGILFLGLAVHTYNSARVFVPLILITLILIHYSSVMEWVRVRKKEAVLAGLVLALFFIPLIISFAFPQSWARYKWVGILDQGAINRINMARGNSALPKPLPRLIYNKATYFTLAFAKNYFSNFSPRYLFLKGGSNYQYNIPGQGVIYPVQAPLILLGFYYLFKNWRKKESKLILFWWLLAVVPAAATQENPHVLRTILVLPMPQVLAALGIWQFLQWTRRIRWAKWAGGIIYGLVLVILFWRFWHTYFDFYRKNYSWSWQYGYQQVADYVQRHYNEYDQIFMTKKYGEPHEFLLFYLKWDPQKYQKDPNLKRYFRTDWYWVDSFDKFVFFNDWEIVKNVKCQMSNVKCLLITSPGNYPEVLPAGRQDWKKIETINFLDNKPAFEILAR